MVWTSLSRIVGKSQQTCIGKTRGKTMDIIRKSDKAVFGVWSYSRRATDARPCVVGNRNMVPHLGRVVHRTRCDNEGVGVGER